jgi:hypothetical protein
MGYYSALGNRPIIWDRLADLSYVDKIVTPSSAQVVILGSPRSGPRDDTGDQCQIEDTARPNVWSKIVRRISIGTTIRSAEKTMEIATGQGRESYARNNAQSA